MTGDGSRRAVRDGTQLTDEQRQLVELARDFAEREIRPRARACDEADGADEVDEADGADGANAAGTATPWELWRAAASIGLTCFMLPERYGGGGVTDLLTQVLVQEELCYGDIGLGNLLTSGAFFAAPVQELGSARQRERWLPPLCTDDPPMTAVAVTEPDAGSDAAAITTRAVRDGDHYRLRGQKTWISNAPDAQLFVVFATVDPAARARGVTAFVVERDTPGLVVSAPMRKMGQRAIRNAEVFLDDVRVPADNRLGEEGQGFYGLMRTFDASRILIGAATAGLARAALDFALAYARQRHQFGVPIVRHQAVGFRLADMAARVDAAHLLTVRAARLFDGGGDVTEESSLAKLVGSEHAMWCTWAAVQTLGGWGYSREFLVEKWMRDAKLEEIEEGTSDIQRLIIARSLERRG